MGTLKPLEGKGSSQRTNDRIIVVIVLARSGNPNNAWSYRDILVHLEFVESFKVPNIIAIKTSCGTKASSYTP
jgi:hypothetical protein